MLKTFLTSLFALACFLCPAQDESAFLKEYESYQHSILKIYSSEGVEAIQDILVSKEVQDLPAIKQYELLVDTCAYSEQVDSVQAIIDGKLHLSLSKEEQDIAQAVFEKDGGLTLLESVMGNSCLSSQERMHFAHQLLDRGSKMSSKALMLCSVDGDMGLIKFCIAKGAKAKEAGLHGLSYLNPDAMDDDLDSSASPEDLQEAADFRRETEAKLKECFAYLLEQGADVDYCKENGETAVHLASATGNLCMLKLLEQEGADFTKKNTEGGTALHDLCFADSKNAHAIVDLLLSHGLKINEPDEVGCTPLMDACLLQSLDLAKYYIQLGASLSAKDENGDTLLHQVIYGEGDNILEFAKFLLQNGADVNALNVNGVTPLLLACYLERSDVITLLIEEGADLELKDSTGDTPLHNLCYMEDVNELESMKILLEHGANINALDADKTTPLLLACYQGRSDLAQCLIEYGANATQVVDSAHPLMAAMIGAFFYDKGDIVALIWKHQDVASIIQCIMPLIYLVFLLLSPFIILSLIIIQKRKARKGKLPPSVES